MAAGLLLQSCGSARASEPHFFAPDPIGQNFVVVDGDTIQVCLLPSDESLRRGRLTERDFEEVAAELGVEVAAIKAVTEIEAGPSHNGFWSEGKPIINFDLNVYRTRAAKRKINLKKYAKSHSVIFNRPNTARYGSQQAAQQARLDAAMKIDSISAIEGTFWGMFQIGGFNYQRCGTKSHADFVHRMSRSERDQLALHAEVQGTQDAHHLLLRHLYAQHIVHPGSLYLDDPPLGGRPGADVEVGGADLRHPQGLDQVQGTGHAAFHGILIDAFLVPGRGVGVEPQPPGGLADAVLAELGGLEEHLLCVLRNLAVLAPHDAGQAYGLLLIADQQIARIQHALLPVQGHQLLPLGRPADYDGRALQGVQVKGMHGLSDLHQHVVGDVHHGADGIVAHSDEPALHPQGRLLVLHIIHIMAQIPGADILVDHRDADVPVHGAVTGVAHVGLLHFLPQDSRHLPGDAQHGLAVRPIGRNRNIEYIILQAQVGPDILSHRRVLVQDHDAVHVRPRIPFLVQAQLLPGAEHAV